ncbi:hypothetical protein H4Q26_004113 [Puccinia striiformis f. sp. tritici PST-130]|nr:hypothetical protein H4Q26_004113 [Puccinia striiformis f. sp. tritici PST-130]
MSGSGPPSPSSPLLGTEWLEAQLASLDRGLAAHEPESTTEGSSPPKLQSLCSDISEFEDNYNDIESWMTLSISPSIGPSSSWTLLVRPHKAQAHQCQGFWNMLTASWLSRENLIRSCIDVVDRSVQERNDAIHRLSMDPTDPKNVPPLSSSKTKSQLEAEVYNAELKRRMIHDELTVESTIRKQTIQKFRTRCPESFFSIPADSPPLNWILILVVHRRHNDSMSLPFFFFSSYQSK